MVLSRVNETYVIKQLPKKRHSKVQGVNLFFDPPSGGPAKVLFMSFGKNGFIYLALFGEVNPNIASSKVPRAYMTSYTFIN